MLSRFLTIAALCIATLFPVAALAQGTQVAFGDTDHDADQPVEVTADNLAVDQNDGTAIFTGNVLIGQGEMRLSAPKVTVKYNDAQDAIDTMHATGGVTLVSGEDAAEAQEAFYRVEDGLIEMTGNVLLLQGPNAITGDKMFVDTEDGTARVSGRVKTVLQPAKN